MAQLRALDLLHLDLHGIMAMTEELQLLLKLGERMDRETVFSDNRERLLTKFQRCIVQGLSESDAADIAVKTVELENCINAAMGRSLNL